MLQIESHLLPWYQGYGQIVLVVVVAVYVLLMTLPFVPGIEISLALLMIFGVEGIAVVYVSTLAALCLAFLIGQRIPSRAIARVFGWLHLTRAQGLLEQLEPLSPDERANLLVRSAPARIVPFLLRHRYLTVAVAFNVPGNALLGGGGGIGMVAGISGLFRFPAYALMVALAISPIPLVMLARHVLLPGAG